jgi:tetrahydromethanopterin S-methyltransferase subunit F
MKSKFTTQKPTEISLLWAPNISAIAIMVDDVRMSAEDVKREYPLYSKQLSDMFNVELNKKKS